MITTFKKNTPSGNFYILLYALVLKSPLFFVLYKVQLLQTDGIIYKKIIALINPSSNTSPLFNIITFGLLFSQAILINKIVSEQKLLKSSCYLTGMTYLLITSLFSDWFSLSAPLFANTILLLIYSKVCGLQNNQSPKKTLFFIGLLLGISSFIYFPSICFVLFIIFGIGITRTFNIKEWLITILGVLTPLYIFLSILYLTNKFGAYKFPGFRFSIPNFEYHVSSNVSFLITTIALLIGLYYVNKNISRQVVQTRKSWQIIFLYLFVALIVPFINANINFSFWILLTIPLSPIIAAAFFYIPKKWATTLLHLIMIAIFVAVNILHNKVF